MTIFVIQHSHLSLSKLWVEYLTAGRSSDKQSNSILLQNIWSNSRNNPQSVSVTVNREFYNKANFIAICWKIKWKLSWGNYTFPYTWWSTDRCAQTPHRSELKAVFTVTEGYYFFPPLKHYIAFELKQTDFTAPRQDHRVSLSLLGSGSIKWDVTEDDRRCTAELMKSWEADTVRLAWTADADRKQKRTCWEEEMDAKLGRGFLSRKGEVKKHQWLGASRLEWNGDGQYVAPGKPKKVARLENLQWEKDSARRAGQGRSPQRYSKAGEWQVRGDRVKKSDDKHSDMGKESCKHKSAYLSPKQPFLSSGQQQVPTTRHWKRV